jgi:pSer/pThr/pTyr-binding forkhead associated (FHA) protein
MPVRLRVWAGGRGARGGEPAIPEEGGQAFELEAGAAEIRIGRRGDLELPLPFSGLAPVHARMFRDGGAWFVEDLGGDGGTWLGDERLAPGEPRALAAGARLVVGQATLMFEGEAVGPGKAEGTRTIARRLVGELFAGASSRATPELEVVTGAEAGRRLALRETDRRYLVGRGPAADLALLTEEISREHASFVWTPEGVVVHDLGSKNGVVVAGVAVAAPRILHDGEIVDLGPVTLRLVDPVDRYLRALERSEPPAVPHESARLPAGVAVASASSEAPAAPALPEGLAWFAALARPRASSLLVGVAVAVLIAVAATALALVIGVGAAHP